MRARVAQQADGEQRRQSAKHAAIGDVISGLKAQLRAIEQTDCGGKTVQLPRGADAEERRAIGHRALTLRSGCSQAIDAAGSQSTVRVDRGGRTFFWSLPYRMALCSVLGSTPRAAPMSGMPRPSSSSA